METLTEKESARFWSRVNKDGPTIRTELGPCWVWTAGKIKGYGCLSVSNKTTLTHALSYRMHCGPIAPGMQVCHHCDNPACVRPSHLWLGTNKQNSDDMMAKGRHWAPSGGEHWTHTRPELVARGDRNGSATHPECVPKGDTHYKRLRPETVFRGDDHPNRQHPEKLVRGVNHGGAILTEAAVIEIRAKCAGGASKAEMSRRYGVTRAAIRKVVNRVTWAHVLP